MSSSSHNTSNKINRALSLKERIKDIFTTPGHPAAFSSPQNIHRYFKREGENVSRREIIQALRSVDAYILHKQNRQIKTRNPIFVHAKREQAQFDLCDVSSLAPENDNINFLLTVIDIFTKKLYVRKLKFKTAKRTKKAIRSILDEMKPNGKLRGAHMDRGKEFVNRKVQQLFKKRGIHYSYSTSDVKAPVVERVNGSLKQLIFQHLEHVQNYRYIDHLDHIVETYNNRPHSALRWMSPNDAELPINQNHVFNAHFERFTKIIMKHRKKKHKFKLGDTVMLKNSKEVFQKGYHRRYNPEIYIVIEVDPKKPIPMYTLQSTNNEGEIIEGRAYEHEIQLVDKPVHRIIIQKEITHQSGPRKGKKSFFVSWEGFSSEHDAWIPESDIE